jgi:hypothetical protein
LQTTDIDNNTIYQKIQSIITISIKHTNTQKFEDFFTCSCNHDVPGNSRSHSPDLRQHNTNKEIIFFERTAVVIITSTYNAHKFLINNSESAKKKLKCINYLLFQAHASPTHIMEELRNFHQVTLRLHAIGPLLAGNAMCTIAKCFQQPVQLNCARMRIKSKEWNSAHRQEQI